MYIDNHLEDGHNIYDVKKVQDIRNTHTHTEGGGIRKHNTTNSHID